MDAFIQGYDLKIYYDKGTILGKEFGGIVRTE